jgi:hypothetical protein
MFKILEKCDCHAGINQVVIRLGRILFDAMYRFFIDRSNSIVSCMEIIFEFNIFCHILKSDLRSTKLSSYISFLKGDTIRCRLCAPHRSYIVGFWLLDQWILFYDRFVVPSVTPRYYHMWRTMFHHISYCYHLVLAQWCGDINCRSDSGTNSVLLMIISLSIILPSDKGRIVSQICVFLGIVVPNVLATRNYYKSYLFQLGSFWHIILQ